MPIFCFVMGHKRRGDRKKPRPALRVKWRAVTVMIAVRENAQERLTLAALGKVALHLGDDVD